MKWGIFWRSYLPVLAYRQDFSLLCTVIHSHQLLHNGLAFLIPESDGVPDNFRAVEDGFVAAEFEEGLEHTHIQRFAESARTDEQVHFSSALHDIANQTQGVEIQRPP